MGMGLEMNNYIRIGIPISAIFLIPFLMFSAPSASDVQSDVLPFSSGIVVFASSTTITGSVTSQVTIGTTCGLTFVSGNPINYDAVLPGATSSEQTLVLDNTGNTDATLFVKGTGWIDGTITTQITVDNTKFSTASVSFSSKTSVSSTDQTITSSFSPSVNQNTFWQMNANLINSSFEGSLTQTLDFTASC